MIPLKDHTSRYKIEHAGFVAWERNSGFGDLELHC